jgi:hypothetical protein
VKEKTKLDALKLGFVGSCGRNFQGTAAPNFTAKRRADFQTVGRLCWILAAAKKRVKTRSSSHTDERLVRRVKNAAKQPFSGRKLSKNSADAPASRRRASRDLQKLVRIVDSKVCAAYHRVVVLPI